MKLYIRIMLFFLSSSLLAMDAKRSHDGYYLRHITKFLPSPVMLVGGTEKNRPTLHWSLLGSEPLVCKIGQKECASDKPSILHDEEYKYAVLEPLPVLAPHIIGGEFFDLYSLGSHRLSKDALLFIPQDELISIEVGKYDCQLVPYERTRTLVETINNFAAEKQLLHISFSVPTIPLTQSLDLLEEPLQFVNRLIKSNPNLNLDTSFTDQDLVEIRNKGILPKKNISASFEAEEKCDLALFYTNIGAIKHLVIFLSNCSHEFHIKLLRYFYCNKNEFLRPDVMLFSNLVDTLEGIFIGHNIPLELCNISHE